MYICHMSKVQLHNRQTLQFNQFCKTKQTFSSEANEKGIIRTPSKDIYIERWNELIRHTFVHIVFETKYFTAYRYISAVYFIYS